MSEVRLSPTIRALLGSKPGIWAKHRSKKALSGLLKPISWEINTFSNQGYRLALVSLPSNYFVVYPAYEVLYGLPMTGIVGMYEAIMGSIAHVPTGNALLNCLVVFNVPFTLFKGLLNVGICLLIYKPLSPLLHK